ncbi:MAG: trigger factor, partial [Candidatus Komeilibacteria bacterium]|nr:trigger factor [Candidatus Komeilibacteria bacterium]
MQVQHKNLEKGQSELKVIVVVAEMERFLKRAADRLSQSINIPGFRPGKAPYDMVKKEAGEMKIYENALDEIITHYYWQAVKDNNLDTIGQPQISIDKFAPGNDLEFTATVGLVPSVKLGDYTDFKIKEEEVKIEDKEMEKVLDEIREMRVKETAKLTPAEKGDKAEINFDIMIDGQPLPKGKAEKYPLILGKEQMIPGFEDHLLGLSVGEEKTFKLQFPDGYYDKDVAGKEAEFTVKMVNLYKREMPEIDDELAKQLGGFAGADDLKNKLTENITQEKKYKARQRTEIKMLEKILENTEFGDVPEVLVEAESHKMVHEMQESMEAQGMKWQDYLNSIKKDEKQLQSEFREGAERRVKTALILREVSEKENLRVTEKEVEEKMTELALQYQNNPQAQENLKSEGYRKYLENSLNNEKVLNWLRE